MATYYVRSTGGNDTNDGLSFAQGWASVQKAADTAVGADVVLVCADGSHAPTATVDFDTLANIGTRNTPVIFRGASATGVDNGTLATITGASLVGAISLININVDAINLSFENIRLTASKNHNVIITASSNIHYLKFIGCTIDSATAMGIQTQESAAGCKVVLVNCNIYGNGTAGLGVNNTNGRGGYSVIDCAIHDNGTDGIQDGSLADSCCVNSVIYDNGGDGIIINDTSLLQHYSIQNCTIFGNTGDGLDFSTGSPFSIVITNTIFRSNGGYGINTRTETGTNCLQLNRICSHGNTSGHIDINGGTLPGSGHVLADPSFVSEADGSEDFTPQNQSLLITKALPAGGTSYDWIGAIKPEPAEGAGGGFLSHPGMSGGINA